MYLLLVKDQHFESHHKSKKKTEKNKKYITSILFLKNIPKKKNTPTHTLTHTQTTAQNVRASSQWCDPTRRVFGKL